MSDIQIGKNVDSYCGKCKLVLAHTIESIENGKVKRVHCNTCQAQHLYRANAPGSRKRAAGSSSGRAATATLSYDELLKDQDAGKARPYAPSTEFAERQLLRHSTFGLGIVTTRRGDKIDVLFEDQPRVLVHAR